MKTVKLPIKPTKELLTIMSVQKWSDYWDEGIKMQQELGLDVIPPKAGMEIAAGVYKKVVDHLLKGES